MAARPRPNSTTSKARRLADRTGNFETKDMHSNGVALKNPAGGSCSLSKLAEKINEHHLACCRAAKDALTNALTAGELLIKAKSACKHGEWGDWLANNFAGSDRTARVYMRLARHRQKLEFKTADAAGFDFDMTLSRALEHIAPKATPAVEIASPEEMQRRDQDSMAAAVVEFDRLAEIARVFGVTHEKVFYDCHPESQSRIDKVSFDEYKRDIENWRSAEWFDEAAKRVHAKRDPVQLVFKHEQVHSEADTPKKRKRKRTLAEGRVPAMLARATAAALEQLEWCLDQSGIKDELVAELDRIRRRIEEATK